MEEWYCPIAGCAHSRGDGQRGYATRQSVLQHVLAVHVSTGSAIPAAWYVAVGARLCSHCNVFVTRGEACVGPRCTHYLLRSWENRYDRAEFDDGVFARSLAGPAPRGSEVALEKVLGGRFPFARRVARGCADSVGRTLGILMRALVEYKHGGSCFD